jgi:hypothetical protein
VRDAIRPLHDRKLCASEMSRHVDPLLPDSVYVLCLLSERACIQNCINPLTNLTHVYRRKESLLRPFEDTNALITCGSMTCPRL